MISFSVIYLPLCYVVGGWLSSLRHCPSFHLGLISVLYWWSVSTSGTANVSKCKKKKKKIRTISLYLGFLVKNTKNIAISYMQLPRNHWRIAWHANTRGWRYKWLPSHLHYCHYSCFEGMCEWCYTFKYPTETCILNSNRIRGNLFLKSFL